MRSKHNALFLAVVVKEKQCNTEQVYQHWIIPREACGWKQSCFKQQMRSSCAIYKDIDISDKSWAAFPHLGLS